MRRKKAEREPEVNEEDVGRPNTISSVTGHSASTHTHTHSDEGGGEREILQLTVPAQKVEISEAPLI